MDPAVISALITGACGLTLTGMTHVLNRRHSRATIAKLSSERDQAHAVADQAQAQAALSISAAATAMLTPLTEQVTRLTAHVAELATANTLLRHQVETLEQENKQLHQEIAGLKARVSAHERNGGAAL